MYVVKNILDFLMGWTLVKTLVRHMLYIFL